MTLARWWNGLNGTKKSLVAAGALVGFGGIGALTVGNHINLPQRVTAAEVRLDTLEHSQSAIVERLDRVLCILTLEDDETALDCER